MAGLVELGLDGEYGLIAAYPPFSAVSIDIAVPALRPNSTLIWEKARELPGPGKVMLFYYSPDPVGAGVGGVNHGA